MTTLVLPEEFLAEAGAYFETCGTRGFEGTAMIKHGTAGPSLVIPDQQPWRSPAGHVTVEVTRAGDRLRFTVTGETARRIAAAVTGQLVEADALAALSEDLGPAAGLLCRRLPEAVGTEIEDVVAALRRDALYAKADDLLRRLPVLDRLVSARRAGIPCPP